MAVKEFMECRDNYNKARVDVDADAIVEQIKSLLHTPKGSIQENPEIGYHYDLLRFRKINTDTIDSLNASLKYQIGILFQNANIDVTFNTEMQGLEEILVAHIMIDEYTHKIEMMYSNSTGIWVSNKDFKL